MKITINCQCVCMGDDVDDHSLLYPVCSSTRFSEGIGFCQLAGKAVGNADSADFSAFNCAVKSIHNLIKRRMVIPAVADVQIDIIHSGIF